MAQIVAWAQQPQQPPPSPIIVKVVPPDTDPTGLADVLIGSLGLTGVLVLVSLVAAALFAAGLFWFRSRN